MFLLNGITGDPNATSDTSKYNIESIGALIIFIAVIILTILAVFIHFEIKISIVKNQKISKNNSKENEFEENFIILHQNGKTIKKHFTKDQMEMVNKILDAIPEKPKDI